MKQKMDFTGKTVIVTGGTYGIGGACTELFCERGANVVFCARNEEKGKALEAKLREIYGEDKCLFVACDVSKEEDIIAVIGKTVEKYGRIDTMINNAGWHPNDEVIDDITGQMFNDVLNLNLTSMFLFCKYSLPYLRKVQGSIVNMSSLVNVIGQRLAARYCSAKGGISAMTRSLAVDEGKHGVRVNSVSPGAIITPLSMTSAEANMDVAKTWCHLGRRGTAEECAEACLFLASDSASYITGIDLPVSGGAELDYGVKLY